jgi:hypothetical protein
MDAFQQARACGDLPESVGLHGTLDACQMHAIRRRGVVHVITGFVRFDGLDVGQISRSIHDGRRMAFRMAEVYRKHVPGFENTWIVATADDLGVRTSRYIQGDFLFTAPMMQAGVRVPDAIGRVVGWDNVVKHPGKRAWAAQVLRNNSCDVPYRCLLPQNVDGLLMGAGRSVSTDSPWLLRCMVHTMVVGQGAGVAAAVAAHRETIPRDVPIEAIQTELRRQGVRLD